MDVLQRKQVKMIAIRLKSIVDVWWERQRKTLIRTWIKMKQLMLERVLLEDYKHILFKMNIDRVQGK